MGILKRRSAVKAGRGAVTIVAEGNQLAGELSIKGNLHVDGSVEGKIDSSYDISIGRRGRINGLVRAREIHVSGLLEGEVVCEALYVEAGGKVRARVLSQTLAVDPRGCFQGERRSVAPSAPALEQAAPPERRPGPTVEFGVDAIDSLPNRIILDGGSQQD